MTLSELIDDILLEARNNNISESENLSRYLIEQWIQTYRALLIKQDIDKGRTINPIYTLTIKMHVSKEISEEKHYNYITDDELPTLIDFHYSPGIVSVKDMHGNLLLVGSETKRKYLRFRKYTCNDYIVYRKHNRLCVENNTNNLEYIEVTVIAENPTDLIMCYDPYTDEYPLPSSIWGTIKQMIFKNDLGIMIVMPSDNTNNSKADLSNNSQKQ